MTHIIDALQIVFALPSFRWIGCTILVVLAFQALRLLSGLLDACLFVLRRYVVPVWRISFWLKAVAVGSILCLLSDRLHDALQEFECRYLRPVYLDQSGGLSIEQAISIYERQIARHCDTYEAGIVRHRTAEIASRINSTPLAIYETALLECGLNPFRIRDDRVAAGWIQFTRAGLSGLGVSLEQVIAACRRRDIETIMNLTERYLVRKWERDGRPDMRNTIDLYLAVFAPAHIAAAPDKVVYAGVGNPAYDLNSGLDGWFQDGGKIIRKPSMCDGKITVWEIFLCLERRKGLLLKQ